MAYFQVLLLITDLIPVGAHNATLVPDKGIEETILEMQFDTTMICSHKTLFPICESGEHESARASGVKRNVKILCFLFKIRRMCKYL